MMGGNRPSSVDGRPRHMSPVTTPRDSECEPPGRFVLLVQALADEEGEARGRAA